MDNYSDNLAQLFISSLMFCQLISWPVAAVFPIWIFIHFDGAGKLHRVLPFSWQFLFCSFSRVTENNNNNQQTNTDPEMLEILCTRLLFRSAWLRSYVQIINVATTIDSIRFGASSTFIFGDSRTKCVLRSAIVSMWFDRDVWSPLHSQ